MMFIAAFVTWRVVSGPLATTRYFLSVSLGTGFLAIPAFFFLIVVTVEEIIFLGLRLGISVQNSCTNCLLIWVGRVDLVHTVIIQYSFAQQDIVNSTLVSILFFLSMVASIGVAVIWIGDGTVTSDGTRGQVALFIFAGVCNWSV